jgi:cytokinin dehydrogenase
LASRSGGASPHTGVAGLSCRVRKVQISRRTVLAGMVLLYPVRRELIREPFVRLPDSPVVWLLAVLRAVSPPNEAETQRLVALNRVQYDQAVAVGGTHYPVGAIPLTKADWRTRYGREWASFRSAKRRYDPRNVLAPGQGIFE